MMFAGFSVLNLALAAPRACVAGNMLNQLLNGEEQDWNAVTFWVVFSTLVVTCINCASCCAGLIHYTEWTDGTRAVAVGAGAIVSFLEMLVMGLSIKMWEVGPAPSDKLDAQANFLGAGAVAQVVTKLIYLLYAYLDWETCFLRGGFRAAGNKSAGVQRAPAAQASSKIESQVKGADETHIVEEHHDA